MPIYRCQNCGRGRNTQHCLFKANMSFIFRRWYSELNANLCLGCATTKFFAFEVSTLCLTWFGIIGIILGPIAAAIPDAHWDLTCGVHSRDVSIWAFTSSIVR
jgi:hypothetical protein